MRVRGGVEDKGTRRSALEASYASRVMKMDTRTNTLDGPDTLAVPTYRSSPRSCRKSFFLFLRSDSEHKLSQRHPPPASSNSRLSCRSGSTSWPDDTGRVSVHGTTRRASLVHFPAALCTCALRVMHDGRAVPQVVVTYGCTHRARASWNDQACFPRPLPGCPVPLRIAHHA